MRVTVLGKSPSWEDAAGACSAYLIEHDGYRLLLDCGNGAFSKLRCTIDYVEVDAVLVSHLHADHFFDLVPFSYALTTGPRRGSARPALHAPPGADAGFRRIAGCLGAEDLIDRAFAVTEYAGDAEALLTLGPFTARMREVPHFVLTHAIDLTGPDGQRFTFGADCAPNEALVRLATGTDLLMVESTLTEPERGDVRGHLTPREAGEHGAAAAAGRLVITHYSDELDPGAIESEASAGFGAPVQLAREGAVYTL